MRRFKANTSETARKALSLGPGSTDEFFLFDTTTEFADFALENVKLRGASEWRGGLTLSEATDKVRNGVLETVAASDSLMSKFEDVAFETMGQKVWQNDVVGALPDVPAFLAGHPLAMRRRSRVQGAASPLAVVVDLTTSGAITTDQIRRRGSVIMALVRVLSTRRPVELWAGVGLGKSNAKSLASWVFSRIETAPLNLSVAAHFLTHESVSRHLGYDLCKQSHDGGAWPHDDKNCLQHMESLVAPAFSHVGETLCLPGLFIADESVNNPEKWLRDQLKKLAPTDLSEVA